MKQHVVFGTGALRRIPRLLDRFGARRVLLVTGRASFERCGAEAALSSVLADRDILGRFCDFSENPKIEDAIRGAELFRASRPDAIVAVGGGSALDMAKLVNILSHHEADPLDMAVGRVPVRRAGVPVIAVPTTSGSGSEATHFGVVYVNRTKYSVAAPSMLPEAVVIEPALTHSLSPALTAVTGMDAFSQAVESFWSVNSTVESKVCARRAIGQILRYLPIAVHAPDGEARRAMSKAAHFAGRAINVTKTTGAHAVSYPLTSYFGIPHGHAVVLTLGRWLLFNSQVTDGDVTDARGAQYVRDSIAELVRMIGGADAEDACNRIGALIRSVGLETRLGAMGIPAARVLDVVLPNVNVERVVNNPRAMTATGLQRMVEAIC